MLLFLLAGGLLAQTEISGPLSGTLEQDTYLAVDDISVGFVSSLTIEAGTIIYFQEDVEFVITGVLTAVGTEADSILFLEEAGQTWDGLRFQGGFSDASELTYCRVGGATTCGVDITNSDVSFDHCVFSNNTTNDHSSLLDHRGGGIFIYSGAPTITNCIIADNESVRGAGLYVWRDGLPSVSNTTIRDNDAVFNDQNEGGHGGGIYFYNCNPTVSNLTITSNTADDNGGGFYAYTANPVVDSCDISDNTAGGGGGGIALIQSEAEITNCEIYNNSTPLYGGGIHAYNACLPTIDKCLIRDNTANLRGGGIHAYNQCDPTITRSTIVANTSPTGAGLYIGFNSDATINTNIIANNIEGEGLNATNDSPLAEVAYNNLYNNDAGGMWGNLPDGAGVISTVNENGDPSDVYYNIEEDPEFTDTFLNDYTLLEISPSINAGDPDLPADPDLSIADQGAFSFFQNTPIAFDLLEPADDDTCWTGDTTLVWEASQDPNGTTVHYDVWLDTLADMSTKWQLADSITATSLALNDLDDDQDWYWTVRATDTNTGGMWARDTFHVHTYILEDPNSFTLAAPADGSIQSADGVMLRWNPSSDNDPDDEITYRVMWSDQADFNPQYTGETSDTNLFVDALQDIFLEFPDNTTIYWRVRARDNHGAQTWATPQAGWSFDVVDPDPPNPFALSEPGDRDTCWTGDTTFVWEGTTDPDLGDEVTGYMLWIATNPSFTANLDSFATEDTFYTVTDLDDDLEYWWMVRALDNNTDGRWSSQAWRLRIYQPEAPASFLLASPPNNGEVNDDTVTVAWQTAADPDPGDVITYTVEWTDDPTWATYYSDQTTELSYDIEDLSDPLLAARQELVRRLMEDGFQENDLDELDELPDETWIYWRVRAEDSFGNQVDCSPADGWRFYVNVADPIPSFSLASPEDGDTCWTGDTTFTWNHTEDPEGVLLYYRFHWAENEGFTEGVDSSAATLDSFYTLNGLTDDQTYWWRARAGNLSGSSRMSNETWAVHIFIPESPSAFDLLTPSDQETLSTATPTVTWEASVDPDPGETVQYRVVWATDDAFTQNVDSTTTANTSATLPTLDDDTTYWWKVRALDARTDDVWSNQTWRFHIYIPDPPEDFALALPLNGAIVEEDTVRVHWNAADDPDPDDVITYTVYWSSDADYTPSFSSTTTDTFFDITDLAAVLSLGLDELDELPDNDQIYWKLTAEDSYGFTSNCIPVNGWNFWTDYIAEPPDAFSLINPADGDTVWAGDTTLTWQAATEPDPSDHIIGYSIWWATNSAFTENLDSALVGQAVTEYDISDLLDDSTYYWKVRARDNNTDGTWSTDTRTFHAFVPEAPAAFALAQPDSGDLVADDTVTVRWEEAVDPDLNDEVTYTVMWATDPGFGTVYSGTTQDTFFTITDLASMMPEFEPDGGDELDELPDATTIYWRVRAEDLYGLSTISSPEHGWSFTTNLPSVPQPFNLLSPGEGDTCWTGDTTLTWQTATDPDPDDSVERYVIWWATNSAFTENLDSASVDSPTTSYALTNLTDDETYYWKVRAQDGNTEGRWSSTTRSFPVYIPQPPGAFALDSPADGSTATTADVTVSWTAAIDPDPNDQVTYTLEWSYDSGFSPSSTETTTAASFELTGLTDDETVYWKVTAEDRYGNQTQATPAAGWSFNIDIPQPPLAFDLLSPAQDDTCWTGDTTLTWASTTDPDPGQSVTYVAWWATNSSFSSNLDSVVTADTTADLTNLTDHTRFWWKVKAVDDDGNATWSNQTRRFRVYIPDPPQAFDLTNPGDGDTVWTDTAELSWQTSSDPDPDDVVHYEVWWATDAGFTTDVDSQAVASTSFDLPGLSDDTQYWWKVKAVDRFDNSLWSTSTRSFRVFITQPPAAFTLVSPDSGITTAEDTVTVTWNASSDPDPGDQITYRVEWATNSSFTNYYSGTTQNTTFDITDLADLGPEIDELPDDITVYWRVRAMDEYGLETLCTPNWGRSFSIFIPEPPAAFSLLMPSDGDTVWTGDTTLTWQASSDPDPGDAIEYKVWWATDAAFTQDLDSASTTALSYDLSDLPDDTRFWWKVRAQDTNTSGTWSTETWTFDVFIPDAPAAFTLVSPDSGITTAEDTVTVTWNASSDPDPGDQITYRVEWATNSSFTNYYSGTTQNTTFDITDLADLGPEIDELPDDITVYWRVRAMDEYDQETLCTPNWGRSFSIFIPEPPAAFSLLMPSDGDTVWTGDTTLTWQASSDPDPGDAIEYKVWWATDAAFTQDLDSASTTALSYDLSDLPDDTRFWWKVRAQDTNTSGTWSTETRSFRVFIPDAPAAFTLVSPDSGITTAEDTVTVTWNASSDPDPGDQITYRVEWATNSSFTNYYSGTTQNTTFDITDLADLGPEIDELPDDITVYWRVRAMDEYGQETLCTPNWGRSFSIFIPEPPAAFSLLMPSDGDTVWTGDTTLTWQASSDPDPGDAIEYKVWWATDAAFTQDLDSASTTALSYDLSDLPDDTRFWWKVRAQDTNTSGTWSTETWTFDVFIPDAPAPFNLVGPSLGDTCWTGDTTLTWQASSDADPNDDLTYVVWWATNAAFTANLDSTTTNATSLVMNDLADDTRFWWKVRAQDGYTGGTWSNQTYDFEVFVPEAPGAFALSSPANNAEVNDDTVTVSWDPSIDPDVGDAVVYTVEWSSSDTFVPLYDDTTSGTSYEITDLADAMPEIDELPDDQTVYWRVRATDRYGMQTNATPADGWAFTVRITEAPEAFDLIGPLAGDTCWTGDTTLTWNASSDPDPDDDIEYKVWWATNAAFTEGLDSASTSATSYALNGLDDDTRYWWKVRAQDENTNGTWSTQTAQFDVYIPEAPAAFSLSSPADGAETPNDTVTVSWTASSDPDPDDAFYYTVEWSTSDTFVPLYDDTTYATSYDITDLQDVLAELDEIPDDATVYWRVLATDLRGLETTATPSDGRSFTVRIAEPPAAFSLTGPADGDTCWTGDTTLTWQASSDPDPGDAIEYKVWWATNAAFTEGLDSTSTTATSYALNSLDDDTRYWWKVRAQDTNTSGTWSSETWSLRVYIPEAPAAFSLLEPEDGDTVWSSGTELSWEAGSDNDPNDPLEYVVWWAHDAAFSQGLDSATVSATNYSLTGLSDDSVYYWKVRAQDNYTEGTWSTETNMFRVYIVGAPNPFTLLSPANGDTCWTGDTTLVWESTTDPDPDDVITYVVWWANDEGFSTGLDSTTTADTTLAMTNLPDDTPYWWKVRAQDQNSSGVWSTHTFGFRVYIPEAPGAFTPALPEDGATVENDTVTVFWHPAVDPDPNDVLTYTVSWRSMPGWPVYISAETTDTSLTITGMEDQLDELPDDVTITWIVVAEDQFGNSTEATPAEGWSFDIHVPEPPEPFSLIEPIDGDTCWTGDTTLVWNSTTDPDPDETLEYVLWIANDAAFSTNLDSVTLEDTTYTLTDLPDDTPYWWKVRAQDTNSEGTWSTETGSFEVFIPEAPSTFNLLSPLNNVTLDTPNVDISWQAATDGDPNDPLTYWVWWAENEAFTISVDSIEVAGQNTVLMGLSDDTQYWWKVRAQDGYTEGTWSTQTWSFSVGVPQSPYPFSLLEPENGDTIWTATTNLFTWESTSDPDPDESFAYHFQVATDQFFTNLFDEQILDADTGATVENLEDDTRYWWRVIAIDEQDNATYSNETWYFDTYIPDPPDPFTLALPDSGAVIEEDTVVVYWNPATDPDSGDVVTYTVQWSMFAGFHEYAQATTPDTFLSINGLEDQILAELDELPDDINVFWRVLAVDLYEDTTWATPEDGWSFHVSYEHSPPLAFDLVSPADGDTSFVSNPLFTWETAIDPDPGDSVETYTLVWAEDAAFTIGVDSVITTDTSYTVEDLTDDTQYWWKVRAQDTNTEGRWSTSEFGFLVYVPQSPGPFALADPPNNELVEDDTVTVSWTQSTDPDPGDTLTYTVYWSLDPQFNMANDTTTTETAVSLTYVDTPVDWNNRAGRGDEFGSMRRRNAEPAGGELDELDELPDGETIYWRVQVTDEYGNSLWAFPQTGWSFTVNMPSPPDSFELHEPLNGSTVPSDSVELVWFEATESDPEDSVTGYVVWMANNEAFTENLDSLDVGLNTTHTIRDLEDDTEYWWKVRANDTNSPGRWSNEAWSFDVYIQEPPTAPELVSPHGDTLENIRVDLTWQAATDPDPDDELTYDVWWSTLPDFPPDQSQSTQTQDTTVTIQVPFDDSTYYWRVQALDNASNGTWSDTSFSFRVAMPESPGAFALAGPDNGEQISDSSVTLAWERSVDPDPGDEVTYELSIAWSIAHDPAAVFELSDTTYLLDGIDDLPPPPGNQLRQGGSGEPGRAKAIRNGSRRGGQQRNGTQPAAMQFARGSQANSLLVTSLDDSLPLPDDATLYWRVQAVDQTGRRSSGSPAVGKNFRTYYPDAPEAFTLLQPANGAELPFGPVDVAWEESSDPDPDDTLSYVVVWALNEDFAPSEDSMMVAGTSATLTGLQANTSYYWRVRAQDTNTEGRWSDDVFTFNLDEDHPPTAFQLLTPQHEDTMYTRGPQLTWQPSVDPDSGAISYVIWLATDQYFQEDVDSTTTTNPALTLANLRDDCEYWWAVRAVDPGGNGVWCEDTYSFHVSIPQAPDPFELVAPEDDGIVEQPLVTFTWKSTTDPDPGDELVYQLQWAWNPQFSGALSRMTSDTTTAVSRDSIPDNRVVYWRVRAVDSFGLGRWGESQNGRSFLSLFPDPPAVFSLVGPDSGDAMLTDSLELSWLATTDPDTQDTPHYDVWVDTTAAMATAWQVGDSIADPSLLLYAEDVFPGMAHYWTVRATDSNTEGVWAADTLMLFVSRQVGQPRPWTGIPRSFGIPAVYPNPFNSSATAVVALPEAADIKVVVYNALGRQVAILARGRYEAGYHKLSLNADRLASGIYFVRARADGFDAELKRIVLVR